MPVETIFVKRKKVNHKTGQVFHYEIEQKVWHMPEGFSDELPASITFDTEATLKLIGRIYRGRYESLCAAYAKRKRGKWRGPADYYSNEKAIERFEEEFRKPSFDIPIDGETVILQARINVYGKKWREHPHFKNKGKSYD